jgi:ketosteroid isomerase-like protein
MSAPDDAGAVVRSIYAGWARGDFMMELFHPDVEWSTPHPGAQVRGRDQVLGFLRSYMGAWAEYRTVLEDVRVLPDGRALAFFSEAATGRSSGVETELHPAALITVRDGLVVRYEGVWREDALRLAGLD